MKPRSKRYEECAKLFDNSKQYSLTEAVKVIKQFKPAKFDESVEINFQLGIKPDQSDQNVRGAVSLPGGTGKKIRVLCFVKGEAQKAAEQAGAEYVGAEEFVKKVEGGWFDFDAVVAHPDMMREISKLGKVLGPRGLMPTPKTGTVTTDVAKAIKEIKMGRVDFKNDKTGGLHVMIGKSSFSEETLVTNAKVAVKAIVDAKPQSSKGDYIKRAYISLTQSPSLRLKSSSMGIQEL